MLHRILKVLFVFVLVFAVGTFAMAQRQTGSVTGKVTDEEEIPLPGASITLSGPALMGTLTYASTAGGDFRFPALPPGSDYVLTVEISGFKTLKRGGIIVSVGKTVTINIRLEAAALEEEVTVIAETPTVDVKSSKLSVSYSADLINNIPLGRDYYDIIKTAPGVVEGDYAEYRTFSAHGGASNQNQVAVDGVNLQDIVEGGNPISIAYDSYEEIEFELGFHPAEVGTADGAYVNIVTKSGGNKFAGGFNIYYFSESMARSLIPESEAEAVGLTAPSGFRRWGDYSFNLGGPVIKDKLWFFVNGRYIDYMLEGETIVDGVIEATHTEVQAFSKLTFKPHPSWKISGAWQFAQHDEPIDMFTGINYLRAVESLWSLDNGLTHTVLAMVNWIADQNTFFDLRFNYVKNFDPYRPQPGVDRNLPFLNDVATGIMSGPSWYYQDMDVDKYAFILSGTRFLDNFLGGDHEIKLGVEYDRSYFRFEPFDPYPIQLLTFFGSPYMLQFTSGMPFTGMFIAFHCGTEIGDMPVNPNTKRLSFYLQDSFTIADRLTLNLGVRYDAMNATAPGGRSVTSSLAADPVFSQIIAPEIFTTHEVPEYADIIVWKNLSPRIGAVYDVFGDGKTSLKASWAQYFEPFLMDYYYATAPYPDWGQVIWMDLNMNAQIDVADFYIPLRLPRNPSDYDPNENVDPNLVTPRTNEFIVGIERELFKDFSVSLSYIYKRKTKVLDVVEQFRGNSPDSGWWVPYTAADPGWDGQYGTSDDSQITVYAVKAGAPRSERLVSNPRDAERKYQALELVFQKRMSNGWQILGSVTWSKFEGLIGAGLGPAGGFSLSLDTPNGYVNKYGRLDMDRPLLIKLQGSVMLPLDFMLSAYYYHASGMPWNRTLEIYFPPDPSYDLANPPSVIVNAETPGSRRHQARNNLDIRVEKSFTLGNFGRLGVFVDVLNAFGERWYDIDEDPGGWILPGGTFIKYPTFGQFIKANGLRTYKLSVRFNF